jgi:hypothetical protein
MVTEARMTEPGDAGAEAPIEDGDSLPPEAYTDDPEAPVDEYDKLEDFDPSTGWPDLGFEDAAFPGSAPRLDEGANERA